MTEASELNLTLLPTWPEIPTDELTSVTTVYQCVINSMLTLTRREYVADNMQQSPVQKARKSKAPSKNIVQSESSPTWWQYVTIVITDSGFIRMLKKFRPMQSINVSMKSAIDPWVAAVELFLQDNSIRQPGLAAVWLWVKAMHSYLGIMQCKESERRSASYIALQRSFDVRTLLPAYAFSINSRQPSLYIYIL